MLQKKLKQHIQGHTQTAPECQMKERGSGLKTTSNEFIESVLPGNPLGNDLPQCLVYPPRTAVSEVY